MAFPVILRKYQYYSVFMGVQSSLLGGESVVKKMLSRLLGYIEKGKGIKISVRRYLV